MDSEKNTEVAEKASFMDKFNAFMMKDETFILLVMGAAAAIFCRYLYVPELPRRCF